MAIGKLENVKKGDLVFWTILHNSKTERTLTGIVTKVYSFHGDPVYGDCLEITWRDGSRCPSSREEIEIHGLRKFIRKGEIVYQNKEG